MTAIVPFASLIVPVAARAEDRTELSSLLGSLSPDSTFEVIVVEALDDMAPHRESGSQEDQANAAAFPWVRWLRAPEGRGRQMNHGAREARGAWLVFLHADSRLPPGWLDEVRQAAADPRVVGGSFRFRLDASCWRARLIEYGVSCRVRCFQLPYGDQGLFVRRQVFTRLGGYRDWPLMEDVDLVRRLRRSGRLRHSRLPVVTSARRWERDGWLRRSAENLLLTALFFAGIRPERLARRYQRAGADRTASASCREQTGDRRGS